MLIYIDGTFHDREHARIGVLDHGLLYGDGIFEGIRIYGGRVFELQAHVDRLYRSAQAIALTIPLSPEEMTAAIVETASRNGLHDGYIRLVVTRGEGELGVNPAKCARPSVIIIGATIQLYPDEVYRDGLRVRTCQTRRNSPAAIDPEIKSLNYLNNVLAALELRGTGAHEGLMLSVDGYLCELTADNIFLVDDGRLLTPHPSVGALRGITRAVVMRLATEELGMPVEEGRYTLYDVYTADEAFLTGTGAEVAPVVEVDLRPIGDGTPGPVTGRLVDLFRAYARTTGTPIPGVAAG